MSNRHRVGFVSVTTRDSLSRLWGFIVRVCSPIAMGYLFLVVGPLPALAWEFSMHGEAEWRYRYFCRTGPNDLFGNAPVAQTTPGGGTSIGLTGPAMGLAAPPSGIPNTASNPGLALEGYSVKGADATYAEERLWVYPRIDINNAITLRTILRFQGSLNGQYIGGTNWASNPFYTGWIMNDSRDYVTGTGLASPVLDAFWGSCQLPWGRLVIGQRPAGFGMGWLLHEQDGYTRTISLQVPWGPFLLVVSHYMQDQLIGYTDPNDARNQNGTSFTIAASLDKNRCAAFSQSYAVIYESGGFDIGVLLRVVKSPSLHIFPQPANTYRDDVAPPFFSGVLSAAHLNDPTMPIYGAGSLLLGAAYVKYATGVFAFNAEYDFQSLEFRRNGGRPISGFPQAWAAEMAWLAGPAKLSLAHFYRSGHDRRGGVFNTSNATGSVLTPSGALALVSDNWNWFLVYYGGGGGAIRPYTWLLGLYGCGNNSYHDNGEPGYQDLSAFAMRADYAIAANLNVYGTLLKAYRASNTGTPCGLYDGVIIPFGEWPVRTVFPVDPVPNASDTDLGWEADVGLNWKLLEGLEFNFRFAFWQPGGWFKQAYRDMTLSNPAQNLDPYDNPNGIVNPSRRIDPLIGIETGVLLQF